MLCHIDDIQILIQQSNLKLAYENKAGIINTEILAPSFHFILSMTSIFSKSYPHMESGKI